MDVEDWLRGLGLERYADAFRANDVDARVLPRLTADDLRDLGVGVREADYDRPDTLRPALDGIERLLLVSGNEVGRRVEQHTAVVDAADAADVGFIVYTSILRADTTQNPLAPEHAATEAVLQKSGLPWAAARNGWYVENYTRQIEAYLGGGEIVGAAGEGRVSAATRADYAEAAVALLAGDIVDSGGVHELGGPSFTMAELAATITEVTGTTVTYRDLSAEEFRARAVENGADPGTADFVTALETSIARGELETDPGPLTDLLGRGPTSLLDAVRVARL